MTESTNLRSKGRRRVAAIVVAGAALGVTGAFAVATAQDDPAPAGCEATAFDLRTAADAVRRLEAQRPELFEQSPRPAGYDDLRLAAEWAYRMSVLHPTERC